MMLQEEPRIVKSHDIHIDADYADWIAEVKHRYRSAQVKAAVKVNAEKLLFNWQLGRDLVQKKAEERWGSGVVEQVSLDLKENYYFGFATVEHAMYDEAELEESLTKNVTDLLLEMGTGFAFLG